MTADRLIRIATAAVVAAVAAFAAIVSYSHIYDLARAHGQAGTAARLLPLSVDGLILAASLVMLHEARSKRPAPLLARCMLGLGVAATVGANVAYGLGFGLTGAVISAWPAVAFIGSVELAIGLARAARFVPAAPQVGALPAQPAPDAQSAAQAALAASIAADNPLSQRRVMAQFGLSRAQEREVRQGVIAQANGHHV